MEFKDYERLATLLKEIRKIMFAHERPSGKTKPINKHFDRAIRHIDEARSHLEDMMFIEYPNQATTNVFYGKEDLNSKQHT